MALTVANASRFSDVGAASPETLGLVMLQADPHAWRLDRSTQFAAVSDALADGIAAAGQWLRLSDGVRNSGVELPLL